MPGTFFNADLAADFKLGTLWLALECFGVWLAWRAAAIARFIWKSFIHLLELLARGLGIASIWAWQTAFNRWHYHFVKVDVRRKCPACGWRVKHKVQFSEAFGQGERAGVILHECPICTAVSGQSPVVPSKVWLVSVPEKKEEETK